MTLLDTLISAFQIIKSQLLTDDVDEPEVTLWGDDDDVMQLGADETETTEFTGKRRMVSVQAVCLSVYL